MKNIIFIAAPGAGKGTQAKLISEEYNIPHISTGDLLRDEIATGSKLGEKIKTIIKTGDFVDDETMIKILRKKLSSKECKKGYILDGYPRNTKQAVMYDELMKDLEIDLGIVIFLDIDKSLALKRTLNRIICPKCGASYNLAISALKPKKENICDYCNHELVLREDDNEEVFNKRFDNYISKTKDLIDYYKNLNVLKTIQVSEDKSSNDIFMEIKEYLK